MRRPGRYEPLGFREAKRRLLRCLADGDINHESRETTAENNLLAIGEVTPEEVAALVRRCHGGQYGSSPHHWDNTIEVHVFHPGRGECSPPMGRW